jgi:type IV secretory pathway VirB9-like protein
MLVRCVLACALLSVATSALAQTTREVAYDSRSVVTIQAKLRFTTMIILPDDEEILDFVCGDKDFWIVSGAQNLAYVKPAKAGATTNLNLVTATGNVYSFLLTEGTNNPDLKLYVTSNGTSAGRGQKFYSAAQVEQLRQEASDARLEARDARQEADAAKEYAAKSIDEAVNRFRASYPTQMRFPYRFKANEKPFNVTAIYHDGQFTYIHASAAELPSLYESRDNAPNLVNYQVDEGVYVVPKVLEGGYLAIGKQKLEFSVQSTNGR